MEVGVRGTDVGAKYKQVSSIELKKFKDEDAVAQSPWASGTRINEIPIPGLFKYEKESIRADRVEVGGEKLLKSLTVSADALFKLKFEENTRQEPG